MPGGFACPTPSISLHKSNNARRILECVTPSNVFYSIGILTDLPSTTPFGLALGPTNPGTIAVARETLDFRCAWISHALRLLMPTFSLPCAPRHLAMHASAHKERSPTDSFLQARKNPVSSVLCLAPLHFRREVSRLVSYYALFKGWLLLSQPPRCLRNFTSFSTEQRFGDLR